LLAGASPSDPVFFGMSLEEVDDFFKEFDLLAIFDLLAAAEAAVRIDFLNRAYHGKGDPISRQFRKLFKKQRARVRLEDILSAWEIHRPAAKIAVRDFSCVLSLRHWLAHGRYWTPKFRITYSPADVFDIAHNLLAAIG
jgi:hypothetical protein